MTGPSPRQQAGYIKRLLRRGELEVIDPVSGRVVAALVTLAGRTIRIIPSPEHFFDGSKTDADDEERWNVMLGRLRDSLTLGEAEELLRAVEYERRQEH